MKRIIAMLLAAAMLGVPETFPEDSSPDADITEETETEEFVFIDTKKIDQEIKEIIKKSGAKEENISIAVEFTATGETYYYNADKWMYTASLCKLPVAMTFAHMLKTGEIESSPIKGSRTGRTREALALEKILVNSNYSWYSNTAKKIYGRVETVKQREQDIEYSGMDEALIPEDFSTAQKYSARFFLGIIEELYENAEEYPTVVDYMKKASPKYYLRRKIEKKFEVAQKYGDDRNVVHAAGIIYTDCPILIVVMTENKVNSTGMSVIGNAAEYFANQAAEWSAAYLASVTEEPQNNAG